MTSSYHSFSRKCLSTTQVWGAIVCLPFKKNSILWGKGLGCPPAQFQLLFLKTTIVLQYAVDVLYYVLTIGAHRTLKRCIFLAWDLIQLIIFTPLSRTIFNITFFEWCLTLKNAACRTQTDATAPVKLRASSFVHHCFCKASNVCMITKIIFTSGTSWKGIGNFPGVCGYTLRTTTLENTQSCFLLWKQK